jgi:hypothetical protein
MQATAATIRPEIAPKSALYLLMSNVVKKNARCTTQAQQSRVGLKFKGMTASS